jgi:hypothetical protein
MMTMTTMTTIITATMTDLRPGPCLRAWRAWIPSMRVGSLLFAALVLAASPASAQALAASEPRSGLWIGAALQQDISLLPSGDVCGRAAQTHGSYSCFRADREQYLGVPVAGQPASVVPARATTRVAIHVEHVLVGNLTAGGRVGLAFGGGPTPSKGPPFLPLHLEARLAYWLGPKLSSSTGVRGFVTLVGGLAQVDASREVEIAECRVAGPGCKPIEHLQPGGPNPARQTLVAYKKAGLGFAGVGMGLYGSFVRGSGVVLEVKATQLFPSLGFAISPSISYVFHVE